jgi:hypothetical protein
MKALLLLALSSSVAAAPTNIAGVWNISADVQGNPIAEKCTLTQKENVLTGPCDSDLGTNDATGTIDGDEVKLVHNATYSGAGLVFTYTGKVGADGTLSGKLDVDPWAIGTFTAKRETEK